MYTNAPVAGAMRAYGIPQAAFAIECFMDDIARKIDMDPLEFRRKNLIQGYYEDAYRVPISQPTQTAFSNVWKKALKQLAREVKTQRIRKHEQEISRWRVTKCVLLSYKTGVWPISLEISGARMVLNQDGSIQLQIGATEIGQGADTVFSEMAAEPYIWMWRTFTLKLYRIQM